MDTRITPIGRTNARNSSTPFGIKQADRLHHLFLIGQTGTGKSNLIKNMVLDDILSGRGCALFDPHGDMVQAIERAVPDAHRDRLIYVNLPDPHLAWGYNPITFVPVERRPLVASGILDIFKKQWPKEWGVRMEYLLRNALLTLLSQPQATLADIVPLFQDTAYRRQCLEQLENDTLYEFWTKEFSKYPARLKAEMTIPLANKLGGYLTNPTLHRFLCASEKPLRLRAVMDKGNILLINLSKGQIGEDAANLLGSLLLTSLGLAAYSRSDLAEEGRLPFYMFVDEAHLFLTLSTASVLSESRKYKLSLTAAAQYLSQFDNEIRDALLGNAGTLISFRLGPRDVSYLSKEFEGIVQPKDLMRLPNYEMYVKLMIDGAPTKAFSAQTTVK